MAVDRQPGSATAARLETPVRVFDLFAMMVGWSSMPGLRSACSSVSCHTGARLCSGASALAGSSTWELHQHGEADPPQVHLRACSHRQHSRHSTSPHPEAHLNFRLGAREIRAASKRICTTRW